MNTHSHRPWRAVGAALLTPATGLAATLWAPVPLPWQLTFRLIVLAAVYIVIVSRIWRDAIATLDDDDPHLSPRCRERLRRSQAQHEKRQP